MAVLLNPHAAHLPAPSTAGSAHPPADPGLLHRRLPRYRPSPLLAVPAAAARAGVAEVLVKYEGDRFGLPAFKILGATWAVYRLLCERLGHAPDLATAADPIADLAGQVEPLLPLTLVTATDGNHGRAVARTAAWFGLGAEILMPAGSAAARDAAIEHEGARVTVIDGDYDEAVRIAATLADDSHLVVSDTSWPGYSQIPTWIAEGYETICAEIDAQRAGGRIDALIIPVGVGALAMGMIRHWPHRPATHPGAPARIAVEPTGADCLHRSLLADAPVTVGGPHTSMMAGMNCGTISPVAWPVLRAGLEACVTIEDASAAEAMRLLAAAGIVAGETGAAALGALLALSDADATTRAALGLHPDATVICICTEGATDPENFERVVGCAPRLVSP